MRGWGWSRWLLVLLAALYLASYLGWVSWGPVEDAVRRLAIRPGAPEVFRDIVIGRGEALFVVIAFLLLTPLAVLVALFLLLFGLMVLAGLLDPLRRILGLPPWAFLWLLAGGVGIVAYARSELWMPRLLWVSGVVVQAFLNVSP